jgi:hypothetical protein
MKYKQSYPFEDQKFTPIIKREIKSQRIGVRRASAAHLAQLAQISKTIENQGLPSCLVSATLPDGMGQGIFLHPKAQPIPRGRVIAPYAGIVSICPQTQEDESAYIFELIANIRLSKAEQRLLSPTLAFHPQRRYSVNLDALKKGNFTRFINHSETPNVVAHMVRIPQNALGVPASAMQVIYFAKKKILPGEQLLVSYEDGEKSYWTSPDWQPIPVDPKTYQLDKALKIVARMSC